MKLYRVENTKDKKGLWRDFDGTWNPKFVFLTDGKCRNLPMEDSDIYRQDNKKWFASAPSKETLKAWFSEKDLEELCDLGFDILEFDSYDYKKLSDFEYIFTRNDMYNINKLKIDDIYDTRR